MPDERTAGGQRMFEQIRTQTDAACRTVVYACISGHEQPDK
ncbi:hypothetical protein [Chloroflexus sp.]